MDGYSATFHLTKVLQEDNSVGFMDLRISYAYLYDAVCEFARISESIKGEQTIITQASVAEYNLDPLFSTLWLTDDDNKYVIKYYDGSGTSWPMFRDYRGIYVTDNITAVTNPWNFTVTNADLATQVTGTVGGVSTQIRGESTLLDTSAHFLTTTAVGDEVHNTTSVATGVVIAVTNDTHLVTAMFSIVQGQSTPIGWAGSDAYIIVPQARKKLILDPAPSTPGHIVTIPYLAKPAPVYSQARTYPIDPSYEQAIVRYAAWLYKYRDKDPNFGDAWYKHWEMAVRRLKRQEDKALGRRRITVNLRRRAYTDRSYR